MAWTQPRTWAIGDLVHASDLNTHVRDNLGALSTHIHHGGDPGDGARVRFTRHFMLMGAAVGLARTTMRLRP